MDNIVAQEPGFAVRYHEQMVNATVEEQKAAVDRFGQEPQDEILSIDGTVATIRISGPLSPVGPSPLARYFGFGGTGYADIISAVREVKANSNITEVRFPTDTPGGFITMLDETRQEIAALAKEKSVTFLNMGMIASAGMWLAAVPGAKIVATSPTVETGSIGVKIVGYDNTEALKEYGYKKITILSRNAPNKAAGVDTEAGRVELLRQADAVERIFISRVAEGRGVSEQTVIDTFGKGGLFVAQDPDTDSPDALSVGMIDSLAEGTDVVESVVENDDGEEVPEAQSATPTTQESKPMALKELLAGDPGAKAEHDTAIAEAHTKGVESGQAVITARIEAAKPFLSADSKYPAAITALATQVVAGDVDKSALTAAVAAFDAMTESTASTAAGEEGEEHGETSAQDHPLGSGKGAIETDADFSAAVEAGRKSRGLDQE